MNDRTISLAVALTAVLGAPIAAGAQEQPESSPSPQSPDLTQSTAPNQTQLDMATATPKTSPTVEPAAIEFSAPSSTRSVPITSGPPSFVAQRRDRPVIVSTIPTTPASAADPVTYPEQPIPVKKSTAVLVKGTAIEPTPTIEPTLTIEPTQASTNLPTSRPLPATGTAADLSPVPLTQSIPAARPRIPAAAPAPIAETATAIEFSPPAAAPIVPTRAVLAQSTPVIVPDAVPSTQPLQEQLSTLEQRQQQLEQEIERLKQTLAGSKNTTPAVSIAEDQPQNLTISATGVFFKPRTSTPFDYAIEDAGDALAIDGKLQTADYDRGAGIRVGITYQPPSSALDIAVAYTSLVTSGKDSAIAPANGFLFSTLSSPRQNERAGIASASAALDYNNTDLELGYKFRVGKSLGLRLFGGLKFASINQDLDAKYDQFDYVNGRIKIGNDFSGFGPRVGAEAKLMLGSGFSIFGRGAASILIGDLTSTYRETDNNGADLIANLKRSQSSHTVPVLEAAIGLDWQAPLGKQAKINLSAGYEYQHWFNTSEDLRFVNASNPGLISRSNGDLSLDGFFVKGGLSFEF